MTLIIFYVLIDLFQCTLFYALNKNIYYFIFFIMNMKKYTQAPKQGFTLVELIVVIVILAILATIAFLSFGSQSASARDSKRKTDLSNLASKMNIAMANGTTVLGLVADNLSSVSWAKIGWTWAIVYSWTTWDYEAWWINFSVLWVSATDFADPMGSSYTYKIGATANAGSVFQIAATLENDANGNPWKNGFIVGNFSSRTQTSTSWAINAWMSTWTYTATVWLPNSLVGLFKKSDYILLSSWTTYVVTGTISNVSSDMASLSITFSWGTNYTWATNAVVIKLATDEVAWLVKSTANAASGVVNWSSTFYPYSY